MEKGAVLDLPSSSTLQSVTAGLGWDVTGRGVDLDVSAILFNDNAHVIDTIFFGKLEGSGLKHSGDNLSGAGSGDDEQICINLERVPRSVQQIVLTVHIYSKGITFERVSNAYCRVFDNTGNELARYELREGGRESGLII